MSKTTTITATTKNGTKIALFVYICGRVLKSYSHIWNQHPQVCQLQILQRKENAWFRYFGTRVLKTYCHIWNQHPQICLIANFCEKTKMSKLGGKMRYLGIFEQEF